MGQDQGQRPPFVQRQAWTGVMEKARPRSTPRPSSAARDGRLGGKNGGTGVRMPTPGMTPVPMHTREREYVTSSPMTGGMGGGPLIARAASPTVPGFAPGAAAWGPRDRAVFARGR